jgi:multidrug resistance efflux pump
MIPQQELDARTTELRIAEDDLSNAKELASAAAKVDITQAEDSMLRVSVGRQELRERLRQAELNYKRARQRMDDAIVRATRDGVVAEIPVGIGDRVSVGTILVRLAELDHMIAEVPVAAEMVSQLHVGQPTLIKLPSQPPLQVEGRIHVISPLPSANMTHVVEVEVENPSLLLLAGQPAQVVFEKP